MLIVYFPTEAVNNGALAGFAEAVRKLKRRLSFGGLKFLVRGRAGRRTETPEGDPERQTETLQQPASATGCSRVAVQVAASSTMSKAVFSL